MELLTVAAVSAAATAYWIWAYWVIQPRPFADGWFIYRFAYTNNPTSPPYCWRPLVPMLLRYLGPWVSHAASFATPLVIYGYLGGGWSAAALAVAFVGNKHIFQYDIKHPEMSESVGHLLLVASLWSLSLGSPWSILLLGLAMLCREALGAMLIAVAVLVGAWPAVVAALLAGAVAYFGRAEDRANRHPLVEATNYETAARWTKVKGQNAFDWPQFIGSVRGAPFFVPFAWGSVGSFEHLALAAYAPLWLLSIPASGVSRHLAYAFILFAPFVVACGETWSWFYCVASWFWPHDFSNYAETSDGKRLFLHARG